VRARIVQALAIVALLHVLTPFVDPALVGLDELEEHYGETVQLQGRVARVDPSGEVLRLEVATDEETATVLTRGSPAPLGAHVTVRGQPTPGRSGPVVWADGPVETSQAPAHRGRVPLARALHEAPRLAPGSIAVTGSYEDQPPALHGPAGQMPVDPGPTDPEPGPVLVWGRLVYEPAEAGYQLEATGWRPWTPPSP
jgi:hypothetical protein